MLFMSLFLCIWFVASIVVPFNYVHMYDRRWCLGIGSDLVLLRSQKLLLLSCYLCTKNVEGRERYYLGALLTSDLAPAFVYDM